MCCSKKRAQARQMSQSDAVSKNEGTTLPPQLKNSASLLFQYVGQTGVTVMGPRSGKRYRFDHPGAVITVDPRDRRAMTAVSILRQIEK